MEQNQTNAVEVVNSFEDLLKSVSDVQKEEAPKTEVAPTLQEQINQEPPAQELEEVKIIEEAPKTSEYKKRISQLIEEGFLLDSPISITNDKGEKESVFLSELKNVDKETYTALLTQYKEATEKENKEKYISTEGIDEVTKNLIEIRKAKGDITELIQNNVSAIDKWQSTKDSLTDNEQLQMQVVAWELKGKGLTDRVIDAQLQDYIDNLQLDTEAERIVDENLSAHKGEIENKKNQIIQKAEEEKQNQRQVEKAVATIYKDKKLPEHLQKVFLKNATRFDENGMTNTEKLFFESQKTPEDLAEITFFLSDREAYKAWVSSTPVLKATTKGLTPLFEFNLKATRPAKQSAVTLNERFEEEFNN